MSIKATELVNDTVCDFCAGLSFYLWNLWDICDIIIVLWDIRYFLIFWKWNSEDRVGIALEKLSDVLMKISNDKGVRLTILDIYLVLYEAFVGCESILNLLLLFQLSKKAFSCQRINSV